MYFEGIHTLGSLIYLLTVLPVFEILVGQWKKNHDKSDLEGIQNDWWYDLILYMTVPLQFLFLYLFLVHLTTKNLSPIEYLGIISAMGILAGTTAINVAHELGHRKSKFKRMLSKSLLLTTCYMHFYIEHNRGHHKRVATEEDPASAHVNENLYFFIGRSFIFSLISAWNLEKVRLQKLGKSVFHYENEMLQFTLIQAALLTAIFWQFGSVGLIGMLISSAIGISLLETVNYIQHYGLRREKDETGSYEAVSTHHSWNCGYPIGQILLFELGRHSDHHFIASKKYQTLTFRNESPQMPTGYTGMIVLALLPPLWFKIMNPLVKKYTIASA